MLNISIDKNVINANGLDTATLKLNSDERVKVFIRYGSLKKYIHLEENIETAFEIKTIEPGLKQILVATPKAMPKYLELVSVANEVVSFKELQDQMQGLQMALAELTIMLAPEGGEA